MKAVFLVFAIALAASAAERPNIVLIVADDLGWADVSYHGGEIRTPRIDRLAKEGARLERFYVTPICTPTRAGLMTGRYPIRYGLMRAVLPPWREGGLDISEVTLPEVLARAGYTHRGAFGKWHLGHSSVKYHPLRRGLTEFIGHYNGAIDYFTHEREGVIDWNHGYEVEEEPGYSTDLIAEDASDFIRRYAADDAPFLCYVPFNAPHGPMQSKPEDEAAYSGLGVLPGDWPGNPDERRRKRQALGGMVTALDRGIGRILDTIDEAGIRDNTLVWFFSDNGGVAGIGDNRPLRGSKSTAYEGGIRVAAAVRWPGHVRAGSLIDMPMANVDILPTLMGIAGIESSGGKPLDGVDVSGALSGESPLQDRDLYSYYGQQGEQTEQVAVFNREWKLVISGPNISDPVADASRRTVELFRIAEDKEESRNVAAQHPDLVREMSRKAVRFRALQPMDAVPPYQEGREEFTPPKTWRPPDV